MTEEFSKDMSRLILYCKASSNGDTPSQFMFSATIGTHFSADTFIEELRLKLLFDNIDISNGDNSSLSTLLVGN